MKKLIANIIRGCIMVLGKLPLKFHYFMGNILAWLAKNIFRYRSDVVWVNISRAFPEKKYGQLKTIYDNFYKHLGEIFAETIWFGASSYRRLYKEGIVEVMNSDEINDWYLSSPSLTVLSTHCGNWELLGGICGYRTAGGSQLAFSEENITVVYKKLSSEISDHVFKYNRVNPLRIDGTVCEVESSNILRYAIRHHEERRLYIYPTDQAPYRKAARHPIGKFMNQETNAMFGSVGIACKFSHSVMYMKMKRVKRGRYELSLIPICRDASKMSREEIMRKYYDLLQEEIMETPHNWLWTHKRWK